MNTQNQFKQAEESAARIAFLLAQTHANYYAQEQDREAATIALLMQALELAGGAAFIKPQQE